MAERWDRLPGETGPAYAAFCKYRDLGSGRSVLAAYREKSGRETVGKPAGYWQDWAAKYAWPERAAAYDAHIEQQARLKAEAETIKRRAAMLIRHRQAAELLVGRGVEFFASNKVSKSSDAIQAIGKGVDLERQAEGLPAYVLEIVTANAERLDDILAQIEGGLAACESAGDAAAAGAGPDLAPAGDRANGKHDH